MKAKQVVFIVMICFITFFLGRVSVCTPEETEVEIRVDAKEQIFRDSDGHRLYPLFYKGTYYLPVGSKGLFFDKDVTLQNKNEFGRGSNIDFNSFELGTTPLFKTETLNGVPFTTDDISKYKYTVVLNWAMWCSDCTKTFLELPKTNSFFMDNNIQIVCLSVGELPSDLSVLETRDYMTYVQVTNELENVLQTNISEIPNFLILNSRCQVLDSKSYSDGVLSVYDTLTEIIKKECKEC